MILYAPCSKRMLSHYRLLITAAAQIYLAQENTSCRHPATEGQPLDGSVLLTLNLNALLVKAKKLLIKAIAKVLKRRISL